VIYLIQMELIELVYKLSKRYLTRNNKRKIKIKIIIQLSLLPKISYFTEAHGSNGKYQWQNTSFQCPQKTSKLKQFQFLSINHKKIIQCSQVKTKDNFGRELKKETNIQLQH
jgi:hypothetical protein